MSDRCAARHLYRGGAAAPAIECKRRARRLAVPTNYRPHARTPRSDCTRRARSITARPILGRRGTNAVRLSVRRHVTRATTPTPSRRCPAPLPGSLIARSVARRIDGFASRPPLLQLRNRSAYSQDRRDGGNTDDEPCGARDRTTEPSPASERCAPPPPALTAAPRTRWSYCGGAATPVIDCQRRARRLAVPGTRTTAVPIIGRMPVRREETAPAGPGRSPRGRSSSARH